VFIKVSDSFVIGWHPSKNSADLKPLATALNKSKRKEKGFFLLDLKQHHIASVISVA
jgi:hypothetical protein